MFLLSVHLVNWRSFRNAQFYFPRPHGKKNVILVMAPNEYGKTSLFEALTLGLFGRDGLSLVPRARSVAGDNAKERLKASYSQFLSRTLHRQATESGPARCMVSLKWESDDGEPIELKRTWYFREDRSHKPADDQLQIFEGSERRPLVPPQSIEDHEGWFREWIAQTFIHSSLAEFFLFDGEQVQRYANREMSKQVRQGIEGLLGLPILRNLKDSLGSYAQNRRTSTAAPSDSTVKTVEAEIAQIEEEIAEKTREREKADEIVPKLESELEELTHRLSGHGEATVALVSELHVDEQNYRREAERAIADLNSLLSGDIALAISGPKLRQDTLQRLSAEQKRESWEAGRNEGNQNLARFEEDLSNRLISLKPTINDDTREAVLDADKAAWEALWYPPPEGCSDNYLHSSLSGVMRAQTIDRIGLIERHSSSEILDKIERFNTSVSTADAKKRERLELEQVAPELEEQATKLRKLSEQHERFKTQQDTAQKNIDALSSKLSSQRAELGRYLQKIGASAPSLKLASAADEYAELIDELLREAVPNEVGKVAVEMTKAWKSMAHLSDRIEKIEISEDCQVRMVTESGDDIHEIDKSAGASQVFTQALITAITKVSGHTFPFVVDTPLARLSRQQRVGVVRTFTDRTGQVVLLSTDEEVVNDKLNAIRGRIAASYELRIKHDNGVSVTTVHDLDISKI